MSEQLTPYQVAPKTPLAGSAAAEIREQGEISRRKFPFVLTAAWTALAAAIGGLTGIFVRFVPRLMVPLSFSYDHRVIDGAAAARFMVHLSGVLGDMRRMLL